MTIEPRKKTALLSIESWLFKLVKFPTYIKQPGPFFIAQMTVWLSHGDDCPFSQALPRLFAPKRVKHLWLFPGKKGCAVFPLMAFPPFGGSSVLTETEKRLRMPWQEKVAKFVVRGPERFWQKHEKFMRKNENKHSRWFKVPFSSPSWRSLNPLKGSLNHPKKVTLNHQVIV